MTAAASQTSGARPSAVRTTVVTGFLGSGKTTLVNRVLTDSVGTRLAVLVNEFGELGIDGELIAKRSGNVIELTNGCMCCATGGEILRSLNDLLRTAPDLDGVLVETSGLADPAPIVESLTHLQFDRDLQVDGVVTVIDALHFDRNLDQAEIALNQIVYGDVLLVNKADLVDAETVRLIEQGVRTLNPNARLAPCVQCDVPVEVVVGAAATPRPAAGEHRHLAAGFESVSVESGAPLHRERFQRWVTALPVSVFRAKGFVSFAGDPQPYVFQRVGERNELTAGADGEPAGASRLVLIGRALRRDELARRFHEISETTNEGDTDGG